MRTRYIGAILGTTALAIAAGPAHAQSAPQQAQSVPQQAGRSGAVQTARADNGNPDIIVTAQRRDESLSRTPVSVAVITADTLAKAQIVSQQDLRIATPGLSIRSAFSSNDLNFALRGQTRDATSGTRPGVLPYINDVQIAGGGGATAFYDLQSVQVLKGPQGTLFGRSATGGAVLFTTAKPTDKLSGYASVLGGNYATFKAEGAISGPIVADTVTARLAGVYSRGHGYQLNLYDNSRPGDYERFGVRGSVTVKLGQVTNDLVVDYFHADGGSTVNVIGGLMPLGAPGSPPYFPTELLYAGVATPIARATGIGTLGAVSGVSPAVATATYDAYFADPRRPKDGVRGYLATQQARGPYRISSDANSVYHGRNLIVTNGTTLRLSDSLSVKNIFGYTNLDTRTAFDLDGTPYGIASDGAKGSPECFCYRNEAVSDELQLLGETAGDRLSYVVGGYFSSEKQKSLYYSEFFDLVFAPYGLTGQAGRFDFVLRNRTLAGYAQGTYKLTDTGLSATVGLRYTSERVGKEVLPTDTARATLGDPAPPGYDWDKRRTFDKLSWTLGLQYQASPELLIYAANRRAYKSGGFNGSVSRDGPAAIGGDAFEAERVTDAELGAKFNGRAGNMPLRVNAALYYNWVRQSQRTAYTLVAGVPSATTVTVPRGRVYGLEVDASLQPVRWFSIGGSASVTKAKFLDGNVFVNGISQLFDRVPDTPELSGTLFGDVTAPIGGDLAATLHGDVYHQSRSFTNARSINAQGTTLQAYTIVNARLGIENTTEGWSLTGNVKNLTNKTYYVGGVATGEVYQINLLSPGQPRTFTVEARFRF